MTLELAHQQQVETDYDRTVREDIEIFRAQINEVLAGRTTQDQFRQHRLRRGIYGQRQPGVQMIRTKIPGGIATAAQLDCLADVADEFAAGKGHLTTRQNIQYHFVPLVRVPDLLHKLADLRLTTREACYNTVRNVTACPTAGLNRNEVFDVTPYARKVAFAFLHKELTDNLPRKFKIAFSCGSPDCMMTDIHDLGFIPVLRDGQRGFRVIVGGGLGPMPLEARLLHEFIPEQRIVNIAEAIVHVFNKHGNRSSKYQARFKFIIRDRGWDWVKETIAGEYQDILDNGGIPMPDTVPDGFGGFQLNPAPLGDGALLPVLDTRPASDPAFDRWLETNVEEQKQPGRAIVTVRVDQGNLTGAQLRELARLSRTAGDGLVRIGIDQNALLANIPLANLRRVYVALRQAGLGDAGANEAEDVVSCPGAYSCNLALTKSMNLGAALSEMMKGYRDPQVRKMAVHISGCPNSCGQHWVGDVGFYGNARKIEGAEVPYYQMLLGGGYDAQGMLKFGLTVQALPGRLIPEALRRVLAHFQENRTEGETFREYVLRHKVEFFRQMTSDLAKPAERFPELYKDWGDEVNFSLQLGRSECA